MPIQSNAARYPQTPAILKADACKEIFKRTMKNKPHPLQFFGSMLIDYFRWSQLAPMITMWFFAVLMVFMLYFVNNQDETVDGAWAAISWVAELPVIGPSFTEWLENRATDDGALHFGGDDFKAGAMKVWLLLSLVMMVIGWLASLLFGPFKPLTLKRKLGYAGLGSLALVAGFAGVYFLNSESFNATTGSLVLNFVGIPLLLFLVSCWCLSIAHVLGIISRSLTASQISQTAPQDEKTYTP